LEPHPDFVGTRPDIAEIGDYKLEAQLPSGPDAMFYKASDAQGNFRLLKRLAPIYRLDTERKQLFESESVLAKLINHPNFVRWLSHEHIDGETIQTFQWSDGCSLAQVLGVYRYRGKNLSTGVALHLFEAVLSAFEHILDVSHSNLDRVDTYLSVRPSVLRLTNAGQCLVCDYSVGPIPMVPTPGLGLGDITFSLYAAPEQCVPGRTPDYRATFFSLGVLAFDLLTTKPLFHDSPHIDMQGVQRRKVRCLHPRLSDVNPSLKLLDQLVMSLLQPLPERRNCSIGHVRDALHEAVLQYDCSIETEEASFLVREWESLRESVLAGDHQSNERKQITELN
jgi:serine/threonine protein kinase